MRYFLSLLAACGVSVLIYLLLFGALVSRPLVVDQASSLMDKKLAYADSTPHPKLFIVAGSNARFSHSCAVLEAALHRPCVNMGIAADVALDWTFDLLRSRLAPGDLVYMPIEYDLYSRTRVRMMTGMDAAYRFRHDKRSLLSRGAEGMTRAAFMFSLPTLVQSGGEMALAAVGIERRFNLDTMDPQGDEIGHDGASAAAYRDMIARAPEVLPDTKDILANPDGAQQTIADFLEWSRAHHVTAIGGLPTIFDDRPVPAATIAALKGFYARHGAAFLVLANRSQYPRADFYDTGYHLRQSTQRRHSALLAKALAGLLPGPLSPTR
jgi:hypothetical protein